jgi:hypothetical protein
MFNGRDVTPKPLVHQPTARACLRRRPCCHFAFHAWRCADDMARLTARNSLVGGPSSSAIQSASFAQKVGVRSRADRASLTRCMRDQSATSLKSDSVSYAPADAEMSFLSRPALPGRAKPAAGLPACRGITIAPTDDSHARMGAHSRGQGRGVALRRCVRRG